ncbi:lef-11 [Sucra jujuba nucleopolyhedrovirus]|uniref:Late expression factor 11 n=1 Tax=Sucra jujuba nucleopolyhedrovirus TaxID=1563660 RepID=A0A097P8V9_9ABAC|nr:lef-11 [Sucra jujuba nucleopolyhedrovirus]AIU41267.1 lef-11 [Sucra jujuba nucleopolyhedrovirus]
MEGSAFQNCDRSATGAAQHFESCCLTRSEVYALVREAINKRKHNNDTDGVCDHMDSSGFEAQIEYIRQNLKNTFIIANEDRARCKRIDIHLRRFNEIFKKRNVLEEEYLHCLSRTQKP